MGGFDDFTRRLHGEHEARTTEHNASEAEERRQRHARWDGEVALLEQVAGPILDEAKRACEARGLRPVVERNWDQGRNSDPAVEFKLFGPKQRPYDSSFYEIEANKATIRVENGKVRATVQKRAQNSTVGANFVGYGSDGVRGALESSIASYYDEIDPSRI